MRLTYHVVDVFTRNALEGNPLAVFPDGRGLSDALMQKIARELNLSETTFVLPATEPEAAALVRIFTPRYEMMFAGHPTFGTAYVMRKLGMVDAQATSFALEEKVGLVSIRVEGHDDPMLWLMTPPIEFGAEFDRAMAAAALGLEEGDLYPGVPCRLVTAGNPNVYVVLKDKEAVDRAAVDTVALRRLLQTRREPTCFFVFAPTSEGAYSRMFAEDFGVAEDPATGSATGPLAAFMMHYSLVRNGRRHAFRQRAGHEDGPAQLPARPHQRRSRRGRHRSRRSRRSVRDGRRGA